MSPLLVLSAAALTGATCVAMGLLLGQALRLRLYRGEVYPLAFLLGAPLLSLSVFLLLAVRAAGETAFALVSALSIGLCVWRRAWRVAAGPAPDDISPGWKWLFRGLLLVFGTYTLVHATAPETSPDGVAYHMGMVGRWYRSGGFEWYTTNMYANMPMGVEMLFLHAYSFGRHSSAALVHWQFLLALPLLLLSFGRRFGVPKAGAFAGLLVFLSPVAGVDGASAYVDIATAATAFGIFYLLLMWESDQRLQLAAAAGLLAGFAYACKMTAAPGVPFALGFVAWKLWKQRRRDWKPLLAIAACALAMILPWLLKNVLLVGNPFSPFLNRIFPNPYVRISFEEAYRAQFQTYGGAIKSLTDIPLEVTVRGGALQGLLGPMFLLIPLGLLALRWPLGRRAWIAGLLFGSTYFGNVGTRFLLSAAPFLALTLGMVLTNWRGMAAAVVLTHAFFSWPGVIQAYAHPYAWRLDRFRLKQALRRETDSAFLARTVEGYSIAQIIEREVPPSGRILTFGGVAEAYTSRDIVVSYQGGFNNVAGDLLATGVAPDLVARQAISFRFPSRKVKKMRLVQTATAPDIWSVSELRVLSDKGTELPRQNSWRLRARPNPWDVQFAFDNCVTTRWKAWESSAPGEFLEIDFVRPALISGVTAEMSADQHSIQLRVDVEREDGRWESIAAEPEIRPLDLPTDLRRMVTDDLRRLGFTHVVIHRQEFLASDVEKNPGHWGMTLVGEAPNARLYRLD